MNIRPLRDYILVKPAKAATTTASGLILTGSTDGEPTEAEVIAVGPGLVLDNGTRVRPEVEVGTTVLIPAYVGSEIDVDGVKHRLVREEAILAILPPKK